MDEFTVRGYDGGRSTVPARGPSPCPWYSPRSATRSLFGIATKSTGGTTYEICSPYSPLVVNLSLQVAKGRSRVGPGMPVSARPDASRKSDFGRRRTWIPPNL